MATDIQWVSFCKRMLKIKMRRSAFIIGCYVLFT